MAENKKAMENDDVNVVNGPLYRELLSLSWGTRVPLLVVGPSGAGKTAISVQWARDKGVNLFVSNLSDKGPQEAGGYGIPDSETRDMYFSCPEGIPSRSRIGDAEALWLLDELFNWDPQVASMFHGVLHPPGDGPRFLGNHEIGPNVRIVATANLRKHGARVVKATVPQIARVIYITLHSRAVDWVDWAEREGYGDTFVPAFVQYHATMGEGAELLYGNASEFDPSNPAPYACHRAWENVCKIRQFTKGRRDACERAASAGCWGNRCQMAFEGFLQVIDQMPVIQAALEDPDNYSPPPAAPMQFALVAAALTTLTRGVSDPETETHTGTFDWFGTLLTKCRGEIARYGAEGAMRQGVAFDTHPKFRKLLF